MALPKVYRLTIDAAISSKLRKTGTSIHSHFFSAYHLPNNLKHSRFGIITGTAIAKKAVVRNRIRRIVQDGLLHKAAGIVNSKDVMIYTKKTIAGADTNQIRADIDSLVEKIS